MKMMKIIIIKNVIWYFRKKNNQLENNLNINFINLKANNYIIFEYDIKKDKLNQSIQILNSYEEVKRKILMNGNGKILKQLKMKKK